MQRLPPNLPSGLAEDGAGAGLWRSVASAPLLLSPTERVMLELACRELDLAELCAKVVAEEGPQLPWGDSSTRAHPLLSKIADHRGLAARLLRSLSVPDYARPAAETRGRGRQRGVYRLYRTERAS